MASLGDGDLVIVSSEPALDQGHYAGGRVTKPSKPKLITRFHDIRTFAYHV
jgi:hypothetical protein